MGIVYAIPSDWRFIIKNNSFGEILHFDENAFYFPVKGKMFDLLSTSSKIMYKGFISFKAVPPTARVKWEEKYPSLVDEWEKFTLYHSMSP